jgi:hypothetical protein
VVVMRVVDCLRREVAANAPDYKRRSGKYEGPTTKLQTTERKWRSPVSMLIPRFLRTRALKGPKRRRLTECFECAMRKSSRWW